MLDLHFAPSADLLAALAENGIREAWKDPFDPPAVIVPSPALGKWLTMRLAGGKGAPGFGCVANLEMQTLERFFWRMLRPPEETALLDADSFAQIICGLLEEQLLKGKIYEPLHAYLLAPDGEETDPVKRIQLSARIARQFLEYEYNRPSVWDDTRRSWKEGIDQRWLKGKNYFDGSGHEEWQKDLYCRAHECLVSAPHAAGTKRLISLPHLYRIRREDAASGARWCEPPAAVLMFGVSKVSHFHRNTLVEMSQMPGVDLRVFLTNPCAEFWEDVDTSRGRGVRRSWSHDSGRERAGILPRRPGDYDKEELQDIAALPRDHALLELWGRAGKENIFLWCPQAQWNFEYHAPPGADADVRPRTVLQAVQRSLLLRESGLQEPAGGWRDDGTLRILACPDPYREIEELREQVLDLAYGKKIGLLNEIAVYLPDPGAYVPYIHRVFAACGPGEKEHIPYCILASPGSDSIFAQGVRALFELIGGRFDRARVFSLLRNPLVRAGRGIAPSQVAIWETWAEALGIYRGYNREHRAAAMADQGQAITDAHTFELGMARMLIGGLAAGPVRLACALQSGDTTQLAIVPPYRDFETQDAALLESFCSIVELLHEELERFRNAANAGIGAVVEEVTRLVQSWFGIIPDDGTVDTAAEGAVRRDFLAAIESVRLQTQAAGRTDVPRLQELLALLEACLPAELPGGSNAWTGGITFAPLRPATVVPHRVIFVLGLDATAFPGTGERAAWDLLSRKRIIGDSDAVRDNRFAFLELLHAARERLILSYRARNMQKEEEVQPSSVLLELEAFLSSQGDATAVWSKSVPWVIHESLGETGRPHGSWSAAEIRLARLGRQERVSHRHDLCIPKIEGRPVASGAPLRADQNDLRKFFGNPLEYHLSKTLGIELDDEPATASATDEPLESGALALSGLQKKIWTAMLRCVFPALPAAGAPDEAALGAEATSLADGLYDAHAASGRSPEAQLCRMERQTLRAWARACAAETLKLRGSFPHHSVLENSDLSLGRAGAAGILTVPIPGHGACALTCRHSLLLLNETADDIGIISIKGSGDAADNPDLWLAGVVQWLAEKNTGSPVQNIRLVQLNRAGGKTAVGTSLAAMKRQDGPHKDIGAWLSGFLAAMLIDKCSDHLPFAAIKKIFAGDWTAVTAEAINDLLAGDYSDYCCHLEAFELADARIPEVSDAELQDRARKRFGPLLERWHHE